MSKLFNLKLTTLSPIHIGCNENISPYSDYIYRGDKVHILDENKLMEFFKTRQNMDQIMEDYIEIIKVQASSNIRDKHNLENFFEKYGLEIEDFISYSLEANGKITQNINRTIHSSGRPYIPGSTLKGAIRTSLLHHHIRKDNIRPAKNFPYTGQDVFGSFINDRLKYLSISDTNTVENNKCKILKTGKYNLKKKSLDVPVIVEAIMPKTFLKFSITLKGELNSKYKYLNKDNIDYLLLIINEFYMENIDREIKILEKNKSSELNNIISFYHELKKEIIVLKENKKGAILRIGHGKVFYENTIKLALEKDRIDKKFFPKTRAMTVDNGEYRQVLGWIKVELE